MMAVILAVAGSARASPDGVSTHTAFWPGTICGVYPPLWTRRLCTGLSEPWLIKVMPTFDAERRRHPAPRLTARHWELLHLVAAGHTNAQIARRLGISEGTVRTHLENIYRLLKVSSRTAAVTRAFADRTA